MGATGNKDLGQTLPLVVLVVCFVGLVTVGIGRLATQAVVVAGAQTAADAAALAGAAAGPAAARQAAAANGARLLRFERAGQDVEVIVERRGTEAVARARREGSVQRGQG